MSKQTINIGQTPNDKTGDPLRTAFEKINENFTELYGLVGPDGNIDLSAVDQHIIPATDSIHDLGSPTKQWRSLYVSTGTIYIGNVPITVSNNTLVVGDVDNRVTLATLDDVNTAILNIPAVDLTDYALTADIPDVSSFITANDLPAPVDLTDYALTADIPDVSSFITANDLPAPVDLTDYALTSQIPNVSSFITAEDIPAIPADISDLTDTTNLLVSELVSTTVPTIGGTASADETGITYLIDALSKWAIFSESAFTVGEWTDVQIGWTVTDNNGFTDTIASRGGFGAASFATTLNDWPAPASGKTYVFTSPDYQQGFTNPIELTVGSNNWTFDLNGVLTLPIGATNNGRISNINGISLAVGTNFWTVDGDGGLTFPDTTVQTTAYTGPQTTLDGDVTGSVFADDSTLLVDGVNGKIVGEIETIFGSINDLTVENIYAANQWGVNIGAGGFNNLIVLENEVRIQNVPFNVGSNDIILLTSNNNEAGRITTSNSSIQIQAEVDFEIRVNQTFDPGTPQEETETALWSFESNGELYFPDGTIQTTAYTSGIGSDPIQLQFDSGGIEHTAGFNNGVNEAAFQIRLNTHLDSEAQIKWGFDTDGSLTFPDATVQATAWDPDNTDWAGIVGTTIQTNGLPVGTRFTQSAPTSLVGQAGDTAGSVTFSSGFIYYCTVDFAAAQFYDTTAVLEDLTEATEITANTVIFTKSSVPTLTSDEWTGLDGFPHPKGWTVTINGITREINQVFDYVDRWDVTLAGSAITYSLGTAVRITEPLPIIWKQAQWKGSVIEDDVRNSLTESETFANPPGTVQDGVVITTSGGSKDVIELIPSGSNPRIKLTAPTTEVAGTITLSSAGGDIVDSTGVSQTAQRTEGSWTLVPGANTVSFTVDWNYTYTMWVRGNIPNGIAVWNATVSVTNSNVPVIGTQYGWYYVDGGALVLTAIPDQIVGTAGSISTAAPAVGTTSNTFVFSITNNTAESQTVYYGYTKI